MTLGVKEQGPTHRVTQDTARNTPDQPPGVYDMPCPLTLGIGEQGPTQTVTEGAAQRTLDGGTGLCERPCPCCKRLISWQHDTCPYCRANTETPEG